MSATHWDDWMASILNESSFMPIMKLCVSHPLNIVISAHYGKGNILNHASGWEITGSRCEQSKKVMLKENPNLGGREQLFSIELTSEQCSE